MKKGRKKKLGDKWLWDERRWLWGQKWEIWKTRDWLDKKYCRKRKWWRKRSREIELKGEREKDGNDEEEFEMNKCDH